MKPVESLPNYRAYLVRCWREPGNAPDYETIWRFSIEASWYEQRRGFASLEALVEHLQAELTNQESGPFAG